MIIAELLVQGPSDVTYFKVMQFNDMEKGLNDTSQRSIRQTL
jgi:hypothetical protein